MKKNMASSLRFTPVLVILIFTSCSSTTSLRTLKLTEPDISLIDSVCMKNLIEQHYPGLAIAVARKGKIWTKGYGYADLTLKQAVNPNDHLFRIGSISKSVTASALARMVDQDQIELDTPIFIYQKNLPPDKMNLTMRQLGGHTAGIRHYVGLEFFNNLHYNHVDDALEIFIHDDLLFAPGTQYNYSTHAWTLIAAVMEKAATIPFLEVIDKEVKRPLFLKDLKPDHVDSIHFKRVQFYDLKNNEHTISPTVDNSNKWAGGGFLCSAEDLAKYGIAHTGPGYIHERTLEEFTSSQVLTNGDRTNYGIGFRTGKDDNGRMWFGHSGGSVGGTSMLLIYPEEDLVIVTLVNMSESNMKGLAWEIGELVRQKKSGM